MAYPTYKPTARSFDAGDYPVKVFKAQNGSESRILYGSKRTNMKLSLSYENISDSRAAAFSSHYDEVLGTYNTFTLDSEATAGWDGGSGVIDAVASGNQWRYESPPQISQVRPGISTVTVNLIGVL